MEENGKWKKMENERKWKMKGNGKRTMENKKIALMEMCRQQE